MNNRILYYILVFLCLFKSADGIYCKEPVTERMYREKIFLHIGKDIYISGEPIWFKAYCMNESSNTLGVFSKVLYVELVDHNQKHILGQVLEIKNGIASSSLIIPDTLATGTYSLKAYTNWMENFSPVYFYSSTVFIQNPFDDVSLKNFDFSNLNDIKVFAEGGQLIDGIKNNIVIQLPFYPKGKTIARILDENNQLTDTALFDEWGLASVKLEPKEGKIYRCKISGEFYNEQQISLPPVLPSGYQISINHATDTKILVDVIGSNVFPESLKAEIYCLNEKKRELNVSLQNNSSATLELSKEDCVGGYLRILLKNKNGMILAWNCFGLRQSNSLPEIDSLKQTYTTREKVSLSFIQKGNLMDTLGTYSLSISKLNPLFSTINSRDISNYFSMPSSMDNFVRVVDNQGIIHFLAEEVKKDQGYSYSADNNENPSNYEYPVEDVGNLYQGKCLNRKTNLPVGKIKVLIAQIDSIPLIQSSTCDTNGNFAFLLNGFGKKSVIIQAYKNDTLIDNQVKIVLDNKYHFSNKADSKKLEISITADSLFTNFLTDEIKRVEIERAFKVNGVVSNQLKPAGQTGTPFYGQPDYKSMLDDYVFLNNFQEIVNEVVTYTKFNKKRRGCELSLYNPDFGIYYDDPVTLVDGIPVNNLCLLYSLNSNDIRRIDVQNHERLAGNLIYKGLVSIYLKGNAKKFHNQLIPENKLIWLDGYQDQTTFTGTDFNEQGPAVTKKPYFINQLFWAPAVKIEGTNNKKIEFYTSDEEGNYLIDLQGIDSKGYPVHLQRTFTVRNH